MEAFKINSGNELHGDVVISGAKNAALPILLATILAESALEITNVPKLNDIETSLKLLAELGADVSWSGDRKPDPKTGKLPPVGNTVNIKAATYTNNIGSTMLTKVWTDPDFDPSIKAVYYVRVLEIPTPRWSTYDAAKLGVALPNDVVATIQERAYSSPIWYTPVVPETHKK